MNTEGFRSYFNDLIDKTNDLIFLVSHSGIIEWVNARWMSLLEYDMQEVQGHALDEYIIDADKNVFRSSLQNAVKEREGEFLSFTFQNKSNHFIKVEGKLEEISEQEGKPLIRGLFKDVTQLEITQKELEQSRKRIEAFFQNSPEAIVVVDQRLRVVAWNNKAQEVFGYSAEEMSGKSSVVLIPERYRGQYKEAVTFFLQTGFSPVLYHPVERKVLNKNLEEFPIRVTISKIDLAGQWYFMGFVSDIREAKKMEEQLIRKEAELMQSKILDEKKNEFLSIASHELKTPLTTIKAYAQLALKIAEEEGDERVLEYVSKMNIHTSKLNYLLTELLDVSKIQAGRLSLAETLIQFDVFLKEVIPSIQHVTSTHIIRFHCNTHVKVNIDALRIEQVLTNLINNAAKYSMGKEFIDIEAYDTDDEVIVSVKDYGIGISEKNIKNLFMRYYRVEETSGSYSGLGIGLYISDQIIQQHKGQLWVESKEGEGSVFYFSLPVVHNNS